MGERSQECAADWPDLLHQLHRGEKGRLERPRCQTCFSGSLSWFTPPLSTVTKLCNYSYQEMLAHSEGVGWGAVAHISIASIAEGHMKTLIVKCIVNLCFLHFVCLLFASNKVKGHRGADLDSSHTGGADFSILSFIMWRAAPVDVSTTWGQQASQHMNMKWLFLLIWFVCLHEH